MRKIKYALVLLVEFLLVWFIATNITELIFTLIQAGNPLAAVGVGFMFAGFLALGAYLAFKILEAI